MTKIIRVNCKKLTTWRKDNDLTYAQAALRCGMANKQHWDHFENGKGNVTLKSLARIAKAMGVSATSLLVE